MSRMAECGNLPPAVSRQPYCPVCARLEQVEGTDEEVQRQYDEMFNKLDRIHKLHVAYGRRRR